MHALVTGGAGFIGSHLCESLLAEGHDVTCVDTLHTGKKENLAFAEGHSAFAFLQGDSGNVRSLVTKKPEIIFHNGVYSSSPMYKKEPLLVSRAIGDFIGLLEYARQNDCRVVFASSSSLYNGLPPSHREDMAIRVTDYYTEARFAMERLGQLYHQLYGLPVIALRYFSVYGPREQSKGKYANLISQFLWTMQKGESPVVYGDGTQTRDFIYVQDVVRANLLAAQCHQSDVFNVGTGVATPLKTIVDLLNKKLGTNLQPTYVENKIKNYVAHTQADTTQSEKLLGFTAQITLESGLDKLLAFYGVQKA